jgi:hypothetical protein
MTTFGTIWLVVMSLGFYVCGGLCIFKTRMMVDMAQRNYAKSSKFIRAYPFSNTITKPWYPLFIRCAGGFIWLWALAIDYLVLFRGFK